MTRPRGFSADIFEVQVDVHDFGGDGIGAGAVESQDIVVATGFQLRWFKSVITSPSEAGSNFRAELMFNSVIFARWAQRFQSVDHNWAEWTPPGRLFLQGGDGEDFEIQVTAGGAAISDLRAVTFYTLVPTGIYSS
jgi:hypothetical protein